MVDRTTMCLALAAALLSLPPARASAASNEASTQVESILSYSAPTEPTGNAQEQRESSKATEDCRGCHEDNLALYNRTYHAALEQSCFSCHKGAAAEEHMITIRQAEPCSAGDLVRKDAGLPRRPAEHVVEDITSRM